MFKRLIAWIDERWPLTGLMRLGLEEEIVGGANYAYTMGSALMFIFIIQVVTGVWQLFYYVPTTAMAYNSLNYLRTEVPFGWLIHGLHYWGANAMIVLIALHMCRVFIWGAYKKPRELTWLVGVVLFLLTMGLMFTGAALPWDELGYWASQVGTSIAGTVPFIGEFTKRLMRGGNAMGQLTLSRFFIVHVAILPALLTAAIGVHLVALRKFGESGPWDERKRGHSGQLWPDQIYMDTMVSMSLFILLVALSAFFPPPFTGPADPIDSTYLPKPEWNFLFLYQALKYFKGVWEPVGTVGIPLVGVLILVFAPFIDRNKERNPLRRPLAMTIGSLIVASIVTLTIIGYRSRPAGSEAGSVSTVTLGAKAVTTPLPGAKEGARLFDSVGCLACHAVNGKGGKIGPDLSTEGEMGRTRKWLVAQLRSPKSHDPKSIMPSFERIGEQKLNDLVDYLLSLRGVTSTRPGEVGVGVPGHTAVGLGGKGVLSAPTKLGEAAFFIGSAEHGKKLFNLYCVFCHGHEGKGGVPNPGSSLGKVPQLNPINRTLFSKDPQTFAENIDRILQQGAVPAGPGSPLRMQAFGRRKSLSQEQIADIEAYVLSLNGVNRTQLLYPGIEPAHFFFLVLAVAFLTVVGVAVLRKRK